MCVSFSPFLCNEFSHLTAQSFSQKLWFEKCIAPLNILQETQSQSPGSEESILDAVERKGKEVLSSPLYEESKSSPKGSLKLHCLILSFWFHIFTSMSDYFY